jgi:hypothetical protein
VSSDAFAERRVAFARRFVLVVMSLALRSRALAGLENANGVVA